jgi:beta-phosphoglucomutase
MSRPAVIFDVDGVLVDSYRAHFQSWTQLFRELGLPLSEAEFAASFGRTSREILRQKLGDEASDPRIRALDERKEMLYRGLFRENSSVMPGAIDLLDALAADGFALGVGSSGPAANVDVAIELIGRRSLFTAIVSGADVIRGKPDPQVFLLGAQRLGIPPALCAVVEDAAAGVQAANRAGMVSIGLVGTTTRERLAHARMVLDRLSELTPHGVRRLLEAGATGC